MKSHVGVFSKDSRRLKMVDFQVFSFAYNYCCFFNNLLVWGVQEGKNLIPTVILKEKSPSAIRRLACFILSVYEGAKSQNFRVRNLMKVAN